MRCLHVQSIFLCFWHFPQNFVSKDKMRQSFGVFSWKKRGGDSTFAPTQKCVGAARCDGFGFAGALPFFIRKSRYKKDDKNGTTDSHTIRGRLLCGRRTGALCGVLFPSLILSLYAAGAEGSPLRDETRNRAVWEKRRYSRPT